ncbi:hypothetical protein [Tumidithrix helvetica]|uniref:hypothetical protein n=1 Tax=Tumidithrix helvetica TaxID=3457545 RepID=UPI003CC559E8
MRWLKFFLVGTGVLGLIALGACGGGSQQSNPAQPTMVAKPPEVAPPAVSKNSPEPKTETKSDPKTMGDNHSKPKQGGQVIESGTYHLELVAEGEGDIHLDFFLLKGDNHEAVPEAKVTALVQFPDGSQKSFDLTYDAMGKHYTVKLSSKLAGEYKVVILSDIKGDKVNGRFSFKR